MGVNVLTVLIVVAVLAALAYIRLAPSDPAVWHKALATTAPLRPGPCVDQIVRVSNGASATCLLAISPQDTLHKLEAIALTAPRTQHLAGSADEGRITWVARSFLIGFPDYVTAQTAQTPDGTRLDISSRQRFGNADAGVNAARLKDWLTQL